MKGCKLQAPVVDSKERTEGMVLWLTNRPAGSAATTDAGLMGGERCGSGAELKA